MPLLVGEQGVCSPIVVKRDWRRRGIGGGQAGGWFVVMTAQMDASLRCLQFKDFENFSGKHVCTVCTLV